MEIFSSNHSCESTFSHVGKAVSSNQKSAVRMNQSVRKCVHVVFSPLQSSFTEVCGVSTSLLNSQKFTINHRQSSNRFIALDKPMKKYIQEEQSKKTQTETRWDARLACLVSFSTESRKPFSTTKSSFQSSVKKPKPRAIFNSWFSCGIIIFQN